MAITWEALVLGFAIVVVLPSAILGPNLRWKNAGWWLLFAIAAFIIIGNAVKEVATGSSGLF